MKILHIGLCVQPKPYNGFQKAFIDVVGEENYREISTGDPDLNAKILLTGLGFNPEFKPDLVFMQVQAPNIIDLEVCRELKEKGITIINWTGDKRHEVPQWMIDIAPYVSITAFSNMEDVHKMRALGFKSEFLEIGYDPEIYKPVGEAYDVPEIVFMGNNYGAGHFPMSEFRIKMVEFLQSEYGDRFGVYGHGWNNAKGNINHSQWEEAKYYRGAKIAINCSHFDCDTYNSDRLLRILGTGAFCLSFNHKGMSEVYSSHVNYFSDLKSLKDKIEVCLSDINWMNDVSRLANKLALNNFTFKHQVKNIIKLSL